MKENWKEEQTKNKNSSDRLQPKRTFVTQQVRNERKSGNKLFKLYPFHNMPQTSTNNINIWTIAPPTVRVRNNANSKYLYENNSCVCVYVYYSV